MKETKGGYGIVYQDVMRNKNLSLEAKAIYAYLSSLSGAGGTCYPSVETIQRDMAISKGRLSKYMHELIACGVVEKVRERDGNLYGRNVYKITHEIEVAEDLKRIFQAVENRPVEGQAVEGQAVENLTTNINNTNINSINNNNNNTIVCPEPDKPTPNPSGILLPLNDKSFYDVPLDKIAMWKETYPAVDVEQELKRMIAWLDSNQNRRKTKRGITNFINNWLSREQDKGGRYRNGEHKQEDSVEAALAKHRYKGKVPDCPDGPFQ